MNNRRKPRSHHRMWLLAALAGGMALSLIAQPAFASRRLGPDDHCTYGDATAIAEAYYPRRFGGDPSEDLFVADDTNELCSFRTFITPDDGICFCEHDVFTGGTVFSDIADARGFLAEIEFDFTLIAPEGAEWSGFDTPVKAGRNGFVWRQFGVTFTHAVPGIYELESTYSHPEEGPLTFFVSFTVLSHEIAHDLGRPDGPLSVINGSVNCP